VRAEEVVQAARELGLNPNLCVDAAYPRSPWLKVGAVIVEKRGSKSRVLVDVARVIHGKRRLK